MFCKNCGANLKQSDSFCGMCGTKVLELNKSNEDMPNQRDGLLNQNTMSNQNSMLNNMKDVNNMHRNNKNVSQMHNDNFLIRAYIGENVDKLMNGGFSFNAFFLGRIYLLYRKMWALCLISLLISLSVSLLFNSLTWIFVISLIINFIYSCCFKKLYIKQVKEKVRKIKINNPSANEFELINICKKKGGTSILWSILGWIVMIIILVAFLFLFVFFSILDVSNNNDDGNIKDNYDNGIKDVINNNDVNDIIGELSFSVSSLEKRETSDDTYKSYSLMDMEDYCSMRIYTLNSNYSSAKEYIGLKVNINTDSTYSTIEEKEINGIKWQYMVETTSYSKIYNYVVIKDDKLYDVEYSISDDSGKCSNAHLSTINSFKFN